MLFIVYDWSVMFFIDVGNACILFFFVYVGVPVCYVLLHVCGGSLYVMFFFMYVGGCLYVMFFFVYVGGSLCVILFHMYVDHLYICPHVCYILCHPWYQDSSGMSLCMLAAAGGQNDILRLLIRKGVRVNGRQNTGTTALMHAAEKVP